MTPYDRSLWNAAMRRAAQEEPQLALAILRALRAIKDTLSESQLTDVIRSGQLDRLVAEVLSKAAQDAAFGPARDRLRSATQSSFRYFTTASLPGGGKVNGVLAIRFDYLSPHVVEAIRMLETKVITNLADDMRRTLKLAVEQGLKDGESPRAIAKGLREVIGLAPNQLQEVENFRAALMGEDGRNPFSYLQRDRRFDGTIRKAIDSGEPLTPEQIEKMTDAYRKRRVALNATTNARTAAVDAQRLGNRLAWQEAIDKGYIDGSRVTKTWRGVMDDRERPLHVAQEGVTVPFDQPFPTGEQIPGASTYDCRCVAVYRVARSA